MSLRPRGPASGEQTSAAHASIVWAETLHALAEAHRARRAADEMSRWPLAHVCSHRLGAVRVGAVEGVDAFDEARDATEIGPLRHAFCCRALA
ncbi:MAG: hypothetical protein EPO36_07890 [Chloroflexota bacterium]|nr:MAG: hypothetical protein EPO36_07890 [Chloroflexota bacterium]